MSFANRGAWFAIVWGLLATAGLRSAGRDDVKSDFTSGTIDLGVVVTNVEKSVKFYTEVIGLKELPGFSVPGDFCADAGLTDKQSLTIRVLSLSDDPKATKLKLMSVPGANSKPVDNAFVPSQLGYRYLTIHVTDGDAALARLKKAGVKPLAKGPVPLPAGLPAGNALTVVRDPDGNLVELVGPKK
jgi:catechol 2,3-dioxygenase-like lactoylglutathione lyase family enzyme